MIDRILKNWKTTVLGLAILITCFILVFMEKSTLTEVSVFICGGFFVLFSKDSMLRKKGPVSVLFSGLYSFLPVAGHTGPLQQTPNV